MASLFAERFNSKDDITNGVDFAKSILVRSSRIVLLELPGVDPSVTKYVEVRR